ncbi:MAG: L-seryl-tRNA(Sec) selenium transferase, partial [Acidobacteria bacterium]|nr:L-seryl-tRNA(Sec) selenium transferase [Acidobacteriota bacterium]
MNPRRIPSIDALLQQPAVAARAVVDGRAAVVDALREAADARRALAPAGDDDPAAWIVARALRELGASLAPSLRPVINATGVIIHTNLGRAPLAEAAVARVAGVAAGYSNLEYDVASGTRGHRHVHVEAQLLALTGAEAAAVANNNAAATWLVLAALAAGREVIVSRGELVEIGGGFRVPDIMAQSGATLREVGTTNRTRVSDYAAAITDRTALLLRVHPSNFRMEGFTERPALGALATLAHRFDLPLFEDQGSGWLGLPHPGGWPVALHEEPSVRESVAAGVDLVAFSGDKLLGGPQSGLIVGRADLVARVQRHPLMRAVRAGKHTYAALEATLALWQREPARIQIPIVRMLLESVEAIDARAHALVRQTTSEKTTSEVVSDVPLPETTSEVVFSEVVLEVIAGFSTIGGGSAPQATIPTRLVAIRSATRTADAIEAALRLGSPA